MATTVSTNTLNTVGEQALYTWAALAAGEAGDAVSAAAFADRSVEVTGVFGGASVVIEGSNSGAVYFTLHDAFSNLISFSTNGFKSVTELPRFVRARVVGGDGTTAIAVFLFTRRQAQ